MRSSYIKYYKIFLQHLNVGHHNNLHALHCILWDSEAKQIDTPLRRYGLTLLARPNKSSNQGQRLVQIPIITSSPDHVDIVHYALKEILMALKCIDRIEKSLYVYRIRNFSLIHSETSQEPLCKSKIFIMSYRIVGLSRQIIVTCPNRQKRTPLQG